MTYDRDIPVGTNRYSDAELASRPLVSEQDTIDAVFLWGPKRADIALGGVRRANEAFRDAARARIEKAETCGPEVVDADIREASAESDTTHSVAG